MLHASTILRKYAMLIHRWMGVGFCVLFLVWFLSGIVMMYWGFPEVGEEERLARAEALDASRMQMIRISPEEAYRRLELGGEPDRVRISVLDGRPVYCFHYQPDQFVAYADTGEPVYEIGEEQALRIAAAWTGQPASAAELRGLLEEADQWTLSGYAALRPLFQYAWPDGEEVYVSQSTGEVVQHTTRESRFWAYLGAIPHWLYFAPLRKNQPLWYDIVVWSSGVGTVMTIFGIVVGIWLYSPSKRRFRFRGNKDAHQDASSKLGGLWRAVVSPEGRSSIPYSGQKRWHTMLGLIFGLFACTWAFSGMLSMGPFEWLGERGSAAVHGALRGAEWRPEAFSAESPREALGRVNPSRSVKEVELAFFGGEPVYLAMESPQRSLIIPAQGPPQEQFAAERVRGAIAAGVQPHSVAEVRVVTEYEAYYIDRENNLPLPALFVRLDDSDGSMYYVDLRTARVVQSYGSGGRWNRWLYHGLHSLDLPWLYHYRPAWDATVLFLMLGGTGLCVTSVVIAWRRLRRKAAMASARSAYAAAARHREEESPPAVRAGR